LQIVNEYDHQVLLPLLISTYNFLNPSYVGVGAFSFTSCDVDPKSLYDLMEINEEMTSSLVKNLLNHFKFKKVIDEEAKNSLKWWKVHEVQFLYVEFVAQEILGIVDSQIEAKRIFNVVGIYTNLQRSRLGIKNLEMFISIYKNWPNDACVEGLASMEQFMDMKEAFMEQNEGFIDQVGLLDIRENFNRL